jgi:hypothetical protein
LIFIPLIGRQVLLSFRFRVALIHLAAALAGLAARFVPVRR